MNGAALIAYFVLETDRRPRLLDKVNAIRFNSRRAPIGWQDVVFVVDGSIVPNPASYYLPSDGVPHQLLMLDRQTGEGMAGRIS